MNKCIVSMFAASIVLLGCVLARGQDPAPQSAASQPPMPPPTEVQWPREFAAGGRKLIVYPPQVDSWTDYRTLKFRSAIAVEGVLKNETFGVVEGEATTVVDHALRMVAIIPTRREFRFPGVSAADKAQLEAAVNQLNPPGNAIVMSLDRVVAFVNAPDASLQKTAPVSLDPPKILYSPGPAILLSFMGKPVLKPVDRAAPGVQFVVNTNWDVLFDTASNAYFVLSAGTWLTTPDLINGPFIPTVLLPPSFNTLPASPNWADARAAIPAKPGPQQRVFVTTEPSELIVTDGKPQLRQIPGTALCAVTNTDTVLFLHTDSGNYYYLVAGRWFSASDLNGPWAAASQSLPRDFWLIPDGDPADFVRASVPGTPEAKDAIVLASIPNTTVVQLSEKPVEVTYSGDPKFVPIAGTTVNYAPNTEYSVFKVGNTYYCCHQGVWFTAPTPQGPWAFCTRVDPAIYTIPPTNPNYNVTYVTIQASTPTTVTYSQTAGYSGEYVAANGVLMFGMGVAVGAILANNNDNYYYYYPPRPTLYSYGSGAVYHYGYGGYASAGYRYYGPYGGAGYATAYNPVTGTYGRSAYAYGPYGSARTAAAYNPYTGARAAGAQVSTAYGSAGRAAGYNPTTGTYARAGYSSGAYGSSGFAQAYNPRTGWGAAAGGVSNDYGSAGGYRTTAGGAGAAWNTDNGQGAVAKTANGNVYASNGDTVYRRGSDGSWSSNSGSGWQSASKPQPNTAESRNWDNVQSQAQARDRGDYASQRTSSYQSSRYSGGGGGRRR